MSSTLSKLNSTNRKIASVFERTLVIVSACFLALVAFNSLFRTTILTESRYESFSFMSIHSSMWLYVVASVVVAFVLLALFCLVAKAISLRETNRLGSLIIIVVSSSIFGLWWVMQQHAVSNGFPDSQRLLMYADSAANGDWTSFTASANIADISSIPDDAHKYFSYYPFQSGIFWYFYLFYKMFGSNAVTALQISNVIANEVTLISLILICKQFNSSRIRYCIPVLFPGIFVLQLSSSLPYGNNVGLALGALYLVFQSRALESNEILSELKWIVCSLPCLCLILIIKSTFVLLAIASLMVWIFKLLRSHQIISFVVVCASVALASMISRVPVEALQNKVGYSFGDGMPKTSWIAIGLNESDLTGMPGMWDFEAANIYDSSNGNFSAQANEANASIIQSITNFISSPKEAIRFFHNKLSIEWADPLFQSMMYSELSINSDGVFFDPFASFGLSSPGYLLVVILGGYQIVVYLTALVGMVCFLKKKDLFPTLLLSVSVFFAGFGCYLLWECKSIYTLPFFILMLPMAVYGMSALSSFVRK